MTAILDFIVFITTTIRDAVTTVYDFILATTIEHPTAVGVVTAAVILLTGLTLIHDHRTYPEPPARH